MVQTAQGTESSREQTPAKYVIPQLKAMRRTAMWRKLTLKIVLPKPMHGTVITITNL